MIRQTRMLMDRMVGKVIHQYTILEQLGRGGMGVVYRAHDTVLDRDIALKMMDALMATDPAFMKRFQSEARALAKLNDPNIVSVFNLLETPEGVCIIMELVKGGTLAEQLKRTPLLPVARVLRIFRQVFAALDHAHREGVIHRDIKPGNVMLTGNDTVKITDFGLAKIETATSTTVTKGTAGTIYYMSPEQIRGLGQVDNRGDIYSAGMALYECVAGALPFRGESSAYTIANMIVEGTIPSPDSLNASVPKELAAIVMKAIDRDPGRRFQHAGDVVAALDRFSGLTAPPPAAPVPDTVTATRLAKDALVPRSHTRLFAGIAAALIVAACGYGIMRLMSRPDLPVGPLSRADTARVAVAAAVPRVPAAAVTSGHLRLVAIPGGECAVDEGKFCEAGGGLFMDVLPGTRTVRFRGRGGATRERTLTVGAGDSAIVRCYFEGRVRVEATMDYIPVPAEVIVDGAGRRERSPGTLVITAGMHTLGVRVPDYVSTPREVTLDVEPSFDAPRTYRAEFRLRRGQ